MKRIFWTTVFWLAALAIFIGYIRWFNQPLALDVSSIFVREQPVIVQNTSCSISGSVLSEVENTKVNTPNEGLSGIDSKLNDIKSQLSDINEKLDIQNSNTPNAVSVSLKTTKKTNVWIFPLDGSEYKKYILPPSDDILKDSLNLLFEKSPFALSDTNMDNDGNLTINLQRVPNTSFGGSAAVELAKTAIEKTAMQFTQIKKVTIKPDDILQP